MKKYNIKYKIILLVEDGEHGHIHNILVSYFPSDIRLSYFDWYYYKNINKFDKWLKYGIQNKIL